MSVTSRTRASVPRRRAKRKKRKTPKTLNRIRPTLQPIEPDCYYNDEQLAARWGVHEITVWGWARNGVIDKPVKLGPNTSRWLGRTILQHEQRALEEAGQ